MPLFRKYEADNLKAKDDEIDELVDRASALSRELALTVTDLSNILRRHDEGDKDE